MVTISKTLAILLLVSAIIGCGGPTSDTNSLEQVPLPTAAPANNPLSSLVDSDDGANQVSEMQQIGTPVGITASATDSDPTDTVIYEVRGSSTFAVDRSSGVVTTASVLDYEVQSSYELTIVALSTDGSESSASFTIQVLDAPEGNQPSATPQPTSAPEPTATPSPNETPEPTALPSPELVDSDARPNAILEALPPGNEVGINATVLNVEDPQSVSFTISQNDYFTIDAASGVVTTLRELDFETQTSYELTITASLGTSETLVEEFTVSVDDNLPPNIIQPNLNTQELADVFSVELFGLINDPEGDPINVTLEAEGVTIPVDTNAIGEWSLSDLGLDFKHSRLRLVATDLATSESSTLLFTVGQNYVSRISPKILMYNEITLVSLILDTQTATLTEIDSQTGTSRIISDAGNAGPDLFEIVSATVDPFDNNVIVVDRFYANPIIIDLTTGDRTELDLTFFTDDDPDAFADIVVHELFAEAFLLDLAPIRISVLDFTESEMLTVFENPSSGPRLNRPASIALDSENDVIYVLDSFTANIFAVDALEGEISIIPSGDGPALVKPEALVLNNDGSLAYLIDDAGLISINLETGDRALVSDLAGRANSADRKTLAIDRIGEYVFFIDEDLLIEVDLQNGEVFVSAGVDAP